MEEFIITKNGNFKVCSSPNYNYIFDMGNGNFQRWGNNPEDDPKMAPFGPEILDIEVTTICGGVPNKQGTTMPCSFCYKSNTPNGKNMDIDTFKSILDKMPNTLTQVAFGSGATAIENPAIWDMMSYCRSKGVIPNITVANVDEETASKLASFCGAVAVSRYDNKNVCYDTVQRLHDAGVGQINIHQMVSVETFKDAMETLNDMRFDPRLKHVRAVVLLSLKKKGRGVGFTPLPLEDFKKLVDFGLDNKIGIGFDSCGANKFLSVVKDRANYKQLEQMSEPCESLQFSYYFNSDGVGFPCSFMDGIEPGVNIKDVNDFLKDIWYSEQAANWRERLAKSCRSCPVFKV
jgi:radical SAM protein with 4Fe4S-binding SPASM domain